MGDITKIFSKAEKHWRHHGWMDDDDPQKLLNAKEHVLRYGHMENSHQEELWWEEINRLETLTKEKS